ncbi:iron-containing redox enzyme family protein [Myxococcaceae bacterium GXIMD 01537]
MKNGHPETLTHSAGERLALLARAIGFDDPTTRTLREALQRLSASWGTLPGSGPAPWGSDVCDDASPYELSVAIDARGKPQLRVLVEPMDLPASAAASRTAGRRLYDFLAGEPSVHLGRLHALEDLLLPEHARGPFAFWFAAGCTQGEAPEYKVYFHTQAQGPGRASRIAEEALQRLGFVKAWRSVAEVLGRRVDGLNELNFFALDLSHSEHARVKVYLRHHEATAEELDAVASVARYHRPGTIADFCRLMAGDAGPYTSKGAVTCLTFTDPADERPASATSYFPLSHYARTDLEARERVTRLLTDYGLDPAPYLGTLEACAQRRLDAGPGMHTYAALRWWDGVPRVTVYYSPEVYGALPPPPLPAPRPRPRPPEAIVEHFEAHSIADHPFLARLRREPVDLRKLALVLANFRQGITQDFPRRLATLTANVTDERLRCTLAKQLNDEMGDGDYTRAHRGLFDKMLSVLAPWAPQNLPEALAPGRALGEALEHCYVKADSYEGVGASLVVEVYGKQVDGFIADEFRRQTQIPPSALEWLHLHEHLEVEHADEALDMARLLPTEGPELEAAWRGARAISTASRAFFDTLYRLSYP